MSKVLATAVLALGLAVGTADRAEAISISLDTCNGGPCGGDLSGSIDTEIDLVGGQLEIIVENNVDNDQVGENVFITEIGFVYDGDLTGLSLADFEALTGIVGEPEIEFDGKVTSVNVDFSFLFPTPNTDDRFESGDSVKILLDFDGTITLDNFLSAAAHLQGVGEGAGNSLTLVDTPDDEDVPDDLDIEDVPDDLDVEPEPATLLLFGAGMAVAGARLRRNRK